MFEVTINGKKCRLASADTLAEILRDHYPDYCVAALVNNRLHDLSKVIDGDCEIVPIDLTCEDGMRIYSRTLKYVFIMAVHRCFPGVKVRFMYSIARGQYCELEGVLLDDGKISSIKNTMQHIINANIPFKKQTVPVKQVEEIYRSLGYNDKLELLKYRPDEHAHLYCCSEEKNYLYGYLLPSTGYLKEFSLHFCSPGVVLLYPRHELGGKLPEFEPSVKLDNVMWRSEQWGKTCGVDNIVALNKTIEQGNIKSLVNMCEMRHENMVAEIADNIQKDLKNIRVVLISGPSSSGKTSLSRKIQTQLAVRGIPSIPISMDNYYKNRSEITPDENGEYDLEHINAIDADLFNRDLVNLIAGRQVQLPHFDFASGSRKPGKVVRLEKDCPLIVEGIHGLNETITRLVPRYNKYKIYISALVQINLDDHTPVSTTTARLIRRLVRDSLFRGTGAEETLSMWASVRRGEFRWIYPYQEEADYIFNSELTYELAVLKKYAMPLIHNIPRSSKYFIATNKIEKVLKYVTSVEDDVVPCTSILREFIGGSNYV